MGFSIGFPDLKKCKPQQLALASPGPSCPSSTAELAAGLPAIDFLEDYNGRAMRMLPVLVLFVLDTLWAQEPADSRGWLNQGVQAFRQAKYPDAVRAFQRAVDPEPAFVTARLYLATSYMQQYIPGAVSPENEQLAANARENFLKVLDADPGNKVAITSVASLSLNQKNWDEAQRWYERMSAADPSDRDAFYSLGFITWSRWYPAYQQARVNLAMKPEDPGPIPNQAVKQDLKTRYWSVLDGGISNL
jgi:Tfp pilus assembly protein PilF